MLKVFEVLIYMYTEYDLKLIEWFDKTIYGLKSISKFKLN